MKHNFWFTASIMSVFLLFPAIYASAAENPGQPISKKHEQKMNLCTGRQQWLNQVIDEYATPPLKDQLKKELATHEKLKNEWRKTAEYKEQKKKWIARRKFFYKAHKQEIDSILQQVQMGTLTKEQAHEQLIALFGKYDSQGDKSVIFRELKQAVEKKDKEAIDQALKKLDQRLKTSNLRLIQKIPTHQKNEN
ncbi:hypothetical protein EWI07_00125 [Sporolactobacillus sp. THM7-4]|nr:hypothetical protein EWI07_00125 [Sporolactobacillus sp. THM7-4]